MSTRKLSKSKIHDMILVWYALTTRDSQTPVLNDVRDITMARNGQVALVSYENKVC
jgi:hypothetical protein